MKSIILSCTPAECEKIANGDMSILVRKKAPKEVPFKAYVYETKHATEMPWVDEDGHFIFRGRGQVLGEFVCDKLDKYTFSHYEAEYRVTHIEQEAMCLNQPELIRYGKGKPLYGLHITALKIYDEPKKLHEFRACNFKSMNGTAVCNNYDCKYYQDSGSYMIPPSCAKNGCRVTRPPQSWQYVEE